MKRSLGTAVAALLSGTVSCSLITSPWSYSEVGLTEVFDRRGDGCSECLSANCAADFTECENDPHCVEYSRCRAEHPSPRGYYACGGYEAVEPSYAKLVSCQGCAERCELGSQWACVGRYSLPESEPTVRLSMRFVQDETTGGRRPFSGLTVRACRQAGIECGPARSSTPDPELEPALLAWAQTDELGWATLELPVEQGAAGFEGLLVVSGPGIPTYRVHYTEPLPSGVDEMQLLSLESLLYLLDVAGVPPHDANGVYVLFQVNDCLREPAAGVSVVSIDGTAPLVVYNEGLLGENVNLTATTSAGAGTGAIVGINPAIGLLGLEFRVGPVTINKSAITVVRGEISIIQAGAGSSAEVSPP